MTSIAKIHFELQNGNPLVISYSLQPNSLVPRWAEIVKRRKQTNDLLELKIANKSERDLPELMASINRVTEVLNNYYDRQLPLFTDPIELDRNMLNHLHEEFEEYGERHSEIEKLGGYRATGAGRDPKVFPGTEFKVKFHESWLKLNELIHITEAVASDQTFPPYSCLVQYMPFEYGDPVTEIDKLFLNTDYKWGDLYLGYNTLGKDWCDAFRDNDQRLISNNQIKVQQSFCSEIWLNFSDSFIPNNETQAGFWNWWCKLDPELKSQVPIDNLNKLAIGRYFLGKVIIDQTFLQFHPIAKDWHVPASDVKRRWNLEVFSQIVKATNIELV